MFNLTRKQKDSLLKKVLPTLPLMTRFHSHFVNLEDLTDFLPKFGVKNSNERNKLATLALKTTCTISNVVTVAFEISVSQNVSYCILTTQHKEEIV